MQDEQRFYKQDRQRLWVRAVAQRGILSFEQGLCAAGWAQVEDHLFQGLCSGC